MHLLPQAEEMRRRVYIASPYTKGDVATNVRAQMDAFAMLMDAGLAPYAPLLSHFQHLVHPRDYRLWLEFDRTWVETCDAFLRLPGESHGADTERGWALGCGKPIFFSVSEVVAWNGALNAAVPQLQEVR
jgi:hypothetical protein